MGIYLMDGTPMSEAYKETYYLSWSWWVSRCGISEDYTNKLSLEPYWLFLEGIKIKQCNIQKISNTYYIGVGFVYYFRPSQSRTQIMS